MFDSTKGKVERIHCVICMNILRNIYINHLEFVQGGCLKSALKSKTDKSHRFINVVAINI